MVWNILLCLMLDWQITLYLGVTFIKVLLLEEGIYPFDENRRRTYSPGFSPHSWRGLYTLSALGKYVFSILKTQAQLTLTKCIIQYDVKSTFHTIKINFGASSMACFCCFWGLISCNVSNFKKTQQVDFK